MHGWETRVLLKQLPGPGRLEGRVGDPLVRGVAERRRSAAVASADAAAG